MRYDLTRLQQEIKSEKTREGMFLAEYEASGLENADAIDKETGSRKKWIFAMSRLLAKHDLEID